MKTRLVTALITLALAALLASSSSAQASLVAGWDFSQYLGDGFMSIDGGASFTNVLSANYSDLDPTLGAGFESAAFGTMHADGQFGSTAVDAGSGSEQFLPSAAVGGSLLSNLDAPSLVDFDAFSVLQSEGQFSTESLAMIAPAASSVVFEADLTGAARTGTNWALSLGGRTFSGTSSVAVEFSTDGSSFTSFGSLPLTTVDSKFTVVLGTASTDLAFVRLTFAPSGPDQPLIDNVAMTAVLSEPPTTTTTTTSSTTTTTTSTTATTAPPTTTTSTTATTAPPTTTTTTTTTAPPTTTTSTTATTAPPTTTTTTTTTAPPTTTTSTTATTALPTTTTTTTITAPPTTTTSTSATTAPPTTTTSTTATTAPPTTTTSTTTTAPATTTTSTTATTAAPTTTTSTTATTTAPTTTTSTTATTAPPTTTTSTTAAPTTTTSTTTTAPAATTTSTTTTGPATTTTSTSTTVPGSTTTTTLPTSLSGPHPFQDKSTGGSNVSFLGVGSTGNQICVAGQVSEVDESSSLPPTVTFTYDSDGTIAKANDKKVKGEFVSVSLTLDFSGTNVTPYNQTITADCKLKASLLKEGEQDKVSLSCDLGENFSAFTDLTSAQITSIDNAYHNVKRAKANSKNGKLKISTVGVPTDAELPVSCGLGT